MDIEDCIREGYIQKVKASRDLAEKELREAEYDLSKARAALEDGDFKWAIVKAYYCMFHSAKAVMFSMGYREKKHFAVQVVLEELSKNGKLEGIFLNYFSAAMEAREDADYRYTYPKETAEEIIEYAEGFLAVMGKMLQNKN